jgi:hypothetical protein
MTIESGVKIVKTGEGMTDDELAALVDGQVNDAKTYESSDLIQLREKALKYYEGEIDIPSAPGRSSVVSRDVADTHGLIMPGLMRVFLATDNIAIYNPRTRADEKFARQATDYVNYVVMRECEGYSQFRSAFHDGLLFGNGVLKHWWDFTPEYSTEEFSGLSDDAYMGLVTDPDVEEVLEHTEYDDPDWTPPPPQMMAPPLGNMLAGPDQSMQMAPGGPEPTAPKLHDCKLKRCTSNGRLRLMALPPEDFLLGRGVVALDEERTRFVAHRWIKTRSTLIKEGFDPEKVKDLPAFESVNLDTPEQLARDRHHLFEGDMAPDESTALIEGFECYIQCDYDGDGVAEWRKVNISGLSGKRAILSNDEWGDDLPFSDIVPDPMPHRWRGRSVFDSTEDVQRIKTVLIRQTLDNIYMTTTPRQVVQENAVVNPEVLNDFEIGSMILTRGDVNAAIRWQETPFFAKEAFPIIEYMDNVVERRTGISKMTVALDPEVLQEQTATAVQAAQAAASTKVEEYARNIADNGGLKRVFSKILKLIVKHQDRARTIRLRDEWIEVDPRAWDAGMDVVVNTGLGSGSRERDLAMLAQIAMKQEQLVLNLGVVNPICGIDKLMDTYRLMTEAAAIKPADRFFPEVSPEIMQQLAQQQSQKPPDPKVQAAQIQAQTDMQKMQAEAQFKEREAQLKRQMEQQKAEQDAQLSQIKAQQDAQLQQMQLERQAQIEERQAQADMALKEADAQFKMQQAQADMALKEREAQFKAQQSQLEAQHKLRLAEMQFEFDKKLELLKLWAQTKTQAAKQKSEDGGSSAPDMDQLEFEDMLDGEGAELPQGASMASPIEQAIKQVAESQAQLAHMLESLGQHMANGHSENARMMAQAVMEAARPKARKVRKLSKDTWELQ